MGQLKDFSPIDHPWNITWAFDLMQVDKIDDKLHSFWINIDQLVDNGVVSGARDLPKECFKPRVVAQDGSMGRHDPWIRTIGCEGATIVFVIVVRDGGDGGVRLWTRGGGGGIRFGCVIRPCIGLAARFEERVGMICRILQESD